MRVLNTLLLFFCIHVAGAQILKPVKWSFSWGPINNGETELIFKAKIDQGFHVYSQFLESSDGPVATSFNFDKSKDFSSVGKVAEGKPLEEYDPNFEMKLKFFANEAVFKQKIKILNDKAFSIKGYLNFIDFEFKIPANSSQKTSDQSEKKNDAVEQDSAAINDLVNDSSISDSAVNTESAQGGNTAMDIVKADTEQKEQNKGAWAIFVAGFLGGLLALLTPCVFPMIPLTVSFFTKSSQNRKKGLMNALIYGLSIIAIYVSLGMLITLSLGPDALNAMASNAIVNLAFFIIFLVFATSFLGAFEITLPSSWVNKADSASEKGGLIGIFFIMANSPFSTSSVICIMMCAFSICFH